MCLLKDGVHLLLNMRGQLYSLLMSLSVLPVNREQVSVSQCGHVDMNGEAKKSGVILTENENLCEMGWTQKMLSN